VIGTLPIKKGFWSVGGSTPKAAICVIIKNGIVWCGRVIKLLFSDYLIPVIKKILFAIRTGFEVIWKFINTAPGMGTLGCLIGTGFGLTLIAISRKGLRKDKKVMRLALHIFAGLSFLCSAGALAAGLAFLNFSQP
jgi:hypothetical protein